MKVDLLADIADDIAGNGDKAADQGKSRHLKGVPAAGHLSPQAQKLARLAQQVNTEPPKGDWDITPHPLLAAAAPTRAQFDAEDTTPLVLMRNPIAKKQVIDGISDFNAPVPFNTKGPITLDSSCFHGTVSVQIRGLKSTNAKYFTGKRRYTHIVIQGRFKRDVNAGDLWGGHEMFQISDLIPTSFVNVVYTAAAKMFSSTTRVSPSTSNGQVAGFLNPVLASCQLINVSRPGQEPGMWGAQEDVRLLHPELADKNGDPLPSEQRRRWFDTPSNAGKVLLSTEYVYTWHVWQHWCNLAAYRLQLGSCLGVNLCNYSEGQPMQIMAKDCKTGEYMLNLLLWHKHLLYTEEHTSIKNRLGLLATSVKGLLKGKH